MAPFTPDLVADLRSLCPECGNHTLDVCCQAELTHGVVFDIGENSLRVVSERLSGVEWDEGSSVSCQQCGWRGEVKEIPIR